MFASINLSLLMRIFEVLVVLKALLYIYILYSKSIFPGPIRPTAVNSDYYPSTTPKYNRPYYPIGIKSRVSFCLTYDLNHHVSQLQQVME